MNDNHLDLQFLNANPTFTILIIEDFDTAKEELIADLRALNFTGEILEASTLMNALEQLNSKNLDLVLCDRNLPDGSGVNFIVQLRQHSRHSKVPVIMCTTVNEVKLITYAISQGANEYIIKPWTKDDLVKKISALINKSK
jgi:two-component system chemotaxis response regulator CheY